MNTEKFSHVTPTQSCYMIHYKSNNQLHRYVEKDGKLLNLYANFFLAFFKIKRPAPKC